MDQLIGVRGIVSGRDNEGFKKPKAMPKRTKK